MHDETDDLADRIAGMAASMDAACHRLLADLRRFDDEQGWARQGMISCATWLNWRCGISLGAAREKVRVAHALASLPLIDDALGRGQISYSKVRAMTRVATPENEETSSRSPSTRRPPSSRRPAASSSSSSLARTARTPRPPAGYTSATPTTG